MLRLATPSSSNGGRAQARARCGSSMIGHLGGKSALPSLSFRNEHSARHRRAGDRADQRSQQLAGQAVLEDHRRGGRGDLAGAEAGDRAAAGLGADAPGRGRSVPSGSPGPRAPAPCPRPRRRWPAPRRRRCWRDDAGEAAAGGQAPGGGRPGGRAAIGVGHPVDGPRGGLLGLARPPSSAPASGSVGSKRSRSRCVRCPAAPRARGRRRGLPAPAAPWPARARPAWPRPSAEMSEPETPAWRRPMKTRRRGPRLPRARPPPGRPGGQSPKAIGARRKPPRRRWRRRPAPCRTMSFSISSSMAGDMADRAWRASGEPAQPMAKIRRATTSKM